MLYAQLNENNICIGVSDLASEVPEYNYNENSDYNPITGETTTENLFVSRMIRISVLSENYLGLHYKEDGTWEQVETAV